MVWQETEDRVVVVMLTKTVEKGRVESLQYFPFGHDSSPAEYADTDSTDDFTAVLTFKYIDSDVTRSLTIRGIEMGVKFESQNRWRANETHINQESAPLSRVVHHYHFEGWSDFTLPERDDRKALIDLCGITRSDELENNGTPRIIHSGSGSGRTGTFIALDFLLGELNKGSLEDGEADTDIVFDTVDSLRKQRMLMAQTPEMYHFLYDTLREELTLKLESDARKNFETWFRSVGPLSVVINWPEATDNQFWIDCTLMDGRHNYIFRSLEDIRDLRICIIRDLRDCIKEDSLDELYNSAKHINQYLNNIISSPPQVFYNLSVLRFFEPRDGDPERSFRDFLEMEERPLDLPPVNQSKYESLPGQEMQSLEEKEEDALRERMRTSLLKAGFSEEDVEKTWKSHGRDNKKLMDLTRPTYIKVHRKHMSPDTLDLYELPWEWDKVNATEPRHMMELLTILRWMQTT